MEELFDFPKKETWQQRNDWLNKELVEAEIWPSYDCSDHATALFMDMEIAYCAGAWLSVIVMSVSIIDSHIRETNSLNNTLGTAKLLNTYYDGDNINWLRSLRNKYVHVNIDTPILEMNTWFNNQDELERDATRAVKMTIRALFQYGGT